VSLVPTHSLFPVLVVVIVSSATWGCEDWTLPPMPADAPQQDEVTISGENDSVAAKCGSDLGEIWKDTGRRPYGLSLQRARNGARSGEPIHRFPPAMPNRQCCGARSAGRAVVLCGLCRCSTHPRASRACHDVGEHAQSPPVVIITARTASAPKGVFSLNSSGA
jgi:hypothetical protein